MSRARAVVSLIALSVSAFCFFCAENLPIGLLPVMASGLHTSLSNVGLLVTGYGVTIVVVSVPLVLATRRIPRRYLLTGLLSAFVVSTWLSALAPNYSTLLGARVATALVQAIFWAVVPITAVGLFSPRISGRVVAIVFGGSSTAIILGVPAGTWLGQQYGWRVPFWLLGGMGLLTLVAVVLLIPTSSPQANHAASGAEPDRRRYGLLITVTAVVITGVFTGYTYISPYLTDVSHFSAGAIAPLLGLRGLAGVAGLAAAGALQDRRPRLTFLGSITLLVLSSLGLYAGGGSQVIAVLTVNVHGFALSALVTALQTRVMRVAPGSSDVASAGNSAAFNVGIAGGAAVGGLLLPVLGLRSTALFSGLITGLGLWIALLEPRLARPRPTDPTATGPGATGPGATGDLASPATEVNR